MSKNFIDLFAGAGGLSLGLERAGFSPLFVNELNDDALKTYFNNRKQYFPEGPIKNINYLQDINEANRKYLGSLKKILFSGAMEKDDLDLIVGGPPCQGFSRMGHRRNYSVTKKELPSNFLFKKMIDFIECFQPKVFLFENVTGIKTAKWNGSQDKKTIFDDIKESFQLAANKNYHINHWEIKAYNYGVPQNRPRIFIIGIRKDLGTENTFKHPPRHRASPPDLEKLLADLEDKDYLKRDGLETKHYQFDPDRTTRNFRKIKTILSDHTYSNHSKDITERFSAMLNEKLGKTNSSNQKAALGLHKEKTKKFSQKVLPAKWEGQNPGFTVTSMPDDVIHYSLPRTLSVREWARLQGFPDDYIFYGKRTTGGIRRSGNPQKGIFDRELPKYTQIGNAVAVPVAEAIGKYILTKL
mgnify:CR=1 FL=1